MHDGRGGPDHRNAEPAGADDTGAVRQPRLFEFDATRYSSVSVAVQLRLPESSARAFNVAVALGSLLNREAGEIRNGRQVLGAVITDRRRKTILYALGINARQWRRYFADWEARYLAHRCDRGTWFLFAQVLLGECPACHHDIRIDHVPPPISPRSKAVVTRPHEAVVTRPQSGERTTARAARERPLSERERSPRENRSKHVYEVVEVPDVVGQGLADVVGHGVALLTLRPDPQEGSEKAAPPVEKGAVPEEAPPLGANANFYLARWLDSFDGGHRVKEFPWRNDPSDPWLDRSDGGA